MAPFALRRTGLLDTRVGQWSQGLGRHGPGRVLVRETGASPVAVVPPSDVHIIRSVYAVFAGPDLDPYLLAAILNSKVCQRWFELNCRPETATFPKLRIGQLREFPVASFDRSVAAQIASLCRRRHDADVTVVEEMEALVARAYGFEAD
jgi:hypothetical protein